MHHSLSQDSSTVGRGISIADVSDGGGALTSKSKPCPGGCGISITDVSDGGGGLTSK